ncbi:hypothetical protein GN956_G8041 [Arapaima gigas]
MFEEKMPVQCEDNPQGFGGVVVYDDITHPISSHFRQDVLIPAEFMDNPYGFQQDRDNGYLSVPVINEYLNNTFRSVNAVQVFPFDVYVYGEPVAPDHFYRASSVRPFTMPHSRYVDRQLPAMANGMVEGLYSNHTISHSSQGIYSPRLTGNSLDTRDQGGQRRRKKRAQRRKNKRHV